jgi:hypothetical protein
MQTVNFVNTQAAIPKVTQSRYSEWPSSLPSSPLSSSSLRSSSSSSSESGSSLKRIAASDGPRDQSLGMVDSFCACSMVRLSGAWQRQRRFTAITEPTQTHSYSTQSELTQEKTKTGTARISLSKNESAPDSFELWDASRAASPEVCSQPAYVLGCLHGMARKG